MATAAKKDAAPKAARKKPVRTAPVQKDFPSKLAYFEAMLEHEKKQAEVTNEAKVARLEKRILAKRAAAEKLLDEADKLEKERDALAPSEEDEGFDEFEQANGRDEA